jgi:hypothetical protein
MADLLDDKDQVAELEDAGSVTFGLADHVC